MGLKSAGVVSPAPFLFLVTSSEMIKTFLLRMSSFCRDDSGNVRLPGKPRHHLPSFTLQEDEEITGYDFLGHVYLLTA